MRFMFLVVLAMLVCAPAYAQGISQYDSDLTRLSGELRALMVRADQPAARSPSVRRELYQQLLTLQKRLDRLQEEAARANVDIQAAGHPPDPGLTYAAQIAETLNLAQSDTGAYLDTHDEVFHRAAEAATRSARRLMAAQ